MVETTPPMLKSLTTRRSPFMWTPVKVWPPPLLPAPRLIWFWKNQKPFCASPALSNRSMPKKICLHVPAATEPGQLPLGDVVYSAANPFSKMSLPGRPPVAWFQAQLETSMGSLEPPPVKVVPVEAPCEANSSVFVFALLVVEQSMVRTEWQTLSQSSGSPVPEWLVVALPSSSKTEVSRANAGRARTVAATVASIVVTARYPRRRCEGFS